MSISVSTLHGFRERGSQARRRGSGGVRQGRRRALSAQLELLEERATPTGNIAITDAYVASASGQTLTVESAGEDVYIDVDFMTSGLPSNASYTIDYDVNGLTLDSAELNDGAGESSTASWNYLGGPFIASPGGNEVTLGITPSPGKGSSTATTPII